MKTAVARVDVVRSASAETGFWRIGIVLCAFALLWLEVINHLRNEWSLNAQYSYGWAVPLLAAFIFWRRWSQRPAPEPPSSRALPITLILLCALFLFPIRLIAEANPDWRLVSWAFAVTAATGSAEEGAGTGLRWSRGNNPVFRRNWWRSENFAG